MDMRKCQEEAPKNREDKLLNAALGLSGEVGEVVDHIKKWKFQGHKLNKKEIIEELGDVLWYIREMADGIYEETIRTIGKNLGIPIKEIIQSQEKMTIHTQTSNIEAIEKFNKELQRIKPAWMTLEIDNQCKIQ